MAVTNQENNPQGEVSQKLGSRFSLGVIVLLLVLIGMVVFALLNTWQQASLAGDNNSLDQQITSLNTQIDSLKQQKVDVSKNAVDALTQINSQEIHWSNIITAINTLVPKNADGTSKINFLSYSGSADGKLNLSASTNPAAVPPFADIAQLISVFNNNVYFKDAFVPSISIGKDQTGLSTLTFIFNVTYQEPDLSNVNLTGTSSSSSATPTATTQVPVSSSAPANSTPATSSNTNVPVPRN